MRRDPKSLWNQPWLNFLSNELFAFEFNIRWPLSAHSLSKKRIPWKSGHPRTFCPIVQKLALIFSTLLVNFRFSIKFNDFEKRERSVRYSFPVWFPVPEDVSGTDDHFVAAGKFPHGYHEPLCVFRVDS